MASKITYLLGAGASAPLLPLAIDPPSKLTNPLSPLYGLATGMEKIAGFFEIELRDQKHVSSIKESFYTKAIPLLRELAIESRSFHTLDTLAKYYYLKDKDKLVSLKQGLAKYFLIEQLLNKKFNNKYLVFLTTILQKEQFPTNIKILSWNYDYQLGIAAGKFKHEDFTANAKGRVINKPLIQYFPDVSEKGWISDDADISLVYLNGIAGLYKNKSTENPYANHIYQNYDEDEKIKLIEKILPNTTEYLTFAWEKESVISKRSLEVAQRIIADTEILVVIGYSFPFFNREVDSEIFKVLKQNKKLKIYFQNPQLDGSFLINQFDLINSISIKHIPQVDQFHIPFEM